MGSYLPPTVMTVRLDPGQRAMVDELARVSGRLAEDVLAEAVNAFLSINIGHSQHVREGLRQSFACDFASDDEVRDAFANWL